MNFRSRKRYPFKGDRNPNDKYVYKKELYKPCILIPVLSNSVEKMGRLWVFEYLQMYCNRSGHFVGFVASHSLIKYV